MELRNIVGQDIVRDNFREVFKYYKRRKPPPGLTDVTDVRQLSTEEDFTELKRFAVTKPEIERPPGLRPVESWQMFSFASHPGFVYILNPFLPSHHQVWAKRCLQDYACKPNHTNLDSQEAPDTDNLWQTCVRDPLQRKTLLSRLRWVTLGYHHNWDTKVYSMEDHSPFPPCLSHLSRYVASAVGFPHFSPEAAIVNYYPVGSTLSGHTDHSEFDHHSPIISFSFGCSAIFLLGGATKEVKPLPIFIHSGDVVAMFGPARLHYHGVARILPDSWDFCPSVASSLSDPNEFRIKGSCRHMTSSTPDATEGDALGAAAGSWNRRKNVEAEDGDDDTKISDANAYLENSVLSPSCHCTCEPGTASSSVLFKQSLTHASQGELGLAVSGNCEGLNAGTADDRDIPLALGLSNCEPELRETLVVSHDSVVEDYLRMARININVRQVFTASHVDAQRPHCPIK